MVGDASEGIAMTTPLVLMAALSLGAALLDGCWLVSRTFGFGVEATWMINPDLAIRFTSFSIEGSMTKRKSLLEVQK